VALRATVIPHALTLEPVPKTSLAVSFTRQTVCVRAACPTTLIRSGSIGGARTPPAGRSHVCRVTAHVRAVDTCSEGGMGRTARRDAGGARGPVAREPSAVLAGLRGGASRSVAPYLCRCLQLIQSVNCSESLPLTEC
jgi:hypothetical protein